MGYRSDVLLAIAGPQKELLAFLTAVALDAATSKVFEDFKDEIKWGEHGPNKVFTIQGQWKHYPNYPEVQRFNALWTAAQDYEKELYGCLLEVGEDNDILKEESFGNGFELASISHEIETEINYTGASLAIPTKESESESTGSAA